MISTFYPANRAYTGQKNVAARDGHILRLLCTKPKNYLAFFFSFHDGLGPNFLRGRPLSLDDLLLGWSSLWATEA